MNLPGNRSVRIVEGVRIAVGEKKSKDGPPQKLDHMRFCKWDKSLKTFTLDEETCAAFAAVAGEQDPRKPTRIPIHVYGNLEMVPDEVTGELRPEVPESILWARMAYYSGKRCQCSSEEFHLKDKDKCEKDGLGWPPNPDSLDAYIGHARARKYRDKRKVAERIVRCNPMTCKFATGEANTKNPGVPLCKPQVVFNCALPWAPALGTFARVVSTSWQMYASLRGTLLQIGMQNRGWLLQLPLLLCSEVRTVNADGFTSTILHVEFPGTPEALREKTVEVQGALVGLDRQLAALNPASVLALDEGEDAEAFAGEFTATAHEDPDTSPAFALDNYAQDMAEELGWSAGEFTAQLAAFGDDEEALIQHLEALTGRLAEAEEEAGEVVDAEVVGEEPAPAPDATKPQRLVVPGDAEKLADPEDAFYKPPADEGEEATTSGGKLAL